MRKHHANSADDLETFTRRRTARRRFDDDPEPERRGRLTEQGRDQLGRLRAQSYAEPEIPGGADRWTTWDSAAHGPHPRPHWVVTDLAAVDTDLGVLKTGKEADVHLLRRGLPDGSRQCLLAAKRYRSPEHRLFHRDAGYLEGRRVRRSRETRAMARRTAFGKNLLAEQWAAAEFDMLSRLWQLGAPVPYPVQRDGTEVLLEFIGDADGTAAPRLAELRCDPDELSALWLHLLDALFILASAGIAHGDLSPYNLLVHQGQLVLIDLPQAVDVIANPSGPDYLARDVRILTRWFRAHGLRTHSADADGLTAELLTEAAR